MATAQPRAQKPRPAILGLGERDVGAEQMARERRLGPGRRRAVAKPRPIIAGTISGVIARTATSVQPVIRKPSQRPARARALARNASAL